MWRCWMGFNASHSMGLILFGLIYGYLALAHDQLLFRSPFLLLVGLVMLAHLCQRADFEPSLAYRSSYGKDPKVRVGGH